MRRQAARESGARTYARALPIVPVRARGLTIEGADGRRYLDCLSGAGTLALGHNHPVVLEAIRTVIDSGAPLHALDLATPVQDAFIAELFRTLPPGLVGRARVQFCGPGATDAMDAAFRLVQAATGREGLLAFSGDRHGLGAAGFEQARGFEAFVGRAGGFEVSGRTGGLGASGAARMFEMPRRAEALEGAGNAGAFQGLAQAGAVQGPGRAGEFHRAGRTLDAPLTHLPYPQDYRCPFGVGGARGADLAARWTESVLDDPRTGTPLPAGMILEAVQGEGGVIPAPDDWMRRMREVTAARSVPLIVDETQTGVGRTGAFWAVDHSGITPDVMILSKAIGGSLPLSVVVHSDALDVDEPGVHTSPYRGNQLAMAAGTATMAYVRENHLAERAATLGSRMLTQLQDLARQFAVVGEVRGRGLMIGVEMVEPASSGALGANGGFGDGSDRSGGGVELEPQPAREPRPAAPTLATAVQRECLRRGLIVELGGRHGNVVRLLPPLTISDEQATAVLDRLADALEAVARSSAYGDQQRHRQAG
ncbi:aminotransferase class III-fold pyridoxal phosphate-dependent enzyme [Streptomyces lincolnensis]|uniref:aminotransferase class III-fold pyridoxal phosphate-dependent enzyme n=1 Tax=Streptomyces lincolnensis TaxID=1915 RepID=UPI0037D33A20